MRSVLSPSQRLTKNIINGSQLLNNWFSPLRQARKLFPIYGCNVQENQAKVTDEANKTGQMYGPEVVHEPTLCETPVNVVKMQAEGEKAVDGSEDTPDK